MRKRRSLGDRLVEGEDLEALRLDLDLPLVDLRVAVDDLLGESQRGRRAGP